MTPCNVQNPERPEVRCVFGGDDIEEGLDAAGTMAKLGLMR